MKNEDFRDSLIIAWLIGIFMIFGTFAANMIVIIIEKFSDSVQIKAAIVAIALFLMVHLIIFWLMIRLFKE